MDLPASMRHAIPPPPLEYIHPVMALHGSITYDRPLDNYFDAAMARRPVLVRRPGNLYDTVANAHDTHFQFGPGMFNGSNPTDRCKCPPIGRERWCQRAAHCGSPPDYPSLGWEYPGWRPRRSSYEDRRGAVSVTLAEICSMSPFPTSSECENATAVYPSDGEHLHGLDDHSSDVADAMDFERASDDTFDTSNTNIALSGPRQLPPDCSPVLDFEPHDVFRITCTEAVTKGVDHPEWNIPWVSEARPRVLENASNWVLSKTHFSCSVPPSAPSSPMSTSTLPCARDLVTENSLHQGATTEGKLSGPKPTLKKAEMIEDTAPRRTTPTSQPVTDVPGVVAAQSMHSPATDVPSRALLSGQEHTSPEADELMVQPMQDLPRTKQIFPCLLDGCKQVCSSAGDLMRHQQSLRHRPPQFFCSGCEYGFTRPDALKRHLNNKPRCKAVHKTATADWLRGLEFDGAEKSSPTS